MMVLYVTIITITSTTIIIVIIIITNITLVIIIKVEPYDFIIVNVSKIEMVVTSFPLACFNQELHLPY